MKVVTIGRSSQNEVTINDYDELCLLTSNVEKGAESSITNDHRAVAILGQLAVGYDVELHGGRKLVCHLLLQSGLVTSQVLLLPSPLVVLVQFSGCGLLLSLE